MNTGINEEIGARIRMYRKLRGIKLNEMASRLSKSNSAVSKYENGNVSITIDTLMDIAEILDVTPEQLIGPPKRSKAGKNFLKSGFFTMGQHYTYFISESDGHIYHSLLDVLSVSDESAEAIYYNGVKSFEDYRTCEHIYHGKLESYRNYACFIGTNYVNEADKAFISIATPFNTKNFARGIVCGLSVIFRVPMAFKCIISKEILEENDNLRQELLVGKKDIQLIKRYNSLIRNDTW